MARALSVARVTVGAGREGEYLALARDLASALRLRGQRLWLFRHPSEAGAFLEFREGDSATHTLRAPTGEESRLATELRRVAAYDAAAEELWIEVPFPTTHEPS
jgi:hypothetical protein